MGQDARTSGGSHDPRGRRASIPSTARRRRCSVCRSASRKGEVLALLGPNGAGKTTTMRSILGLTRPRRGTIRFNGSDITLAPRTHRPRRHRLGARRPAAVPDADGRQESADRRQDARPFAAWTHRRDCSHLLAARAPDAPRGGEPLGRRDADGVDRARAARLARPRAVRRAEPGPRAEDRRRTCWRQCGGSKSEGVASLIVEQNAEVALSVADRAAVLDRGIVAWSGDAASSAATHALRQRLLGADDDDGRSAPLIVAGKPAQGLHARAARAARPTFTLAGRSRHR